MSQLSIGMYLMLVCATPAIGATGQIVEPPQEAIAPMPPDSTQPFAPGYPASPAVLGPSIAAEAPQPPPIQTALPAATDTPLPINLATALYLSNARSLVIARAQSSVEEAAARLRGAEVLWLPNLNVGADYYRHDGLDQSTDGTMIRDHKSAFAAGAGATLNFGVTDAIFLPLADRQELSARQYDVQAARNDILLTVALAYFDVQQARGALAGTQDAVEKAQILVNKTTSLARGLVPEIEINRARAELYDLQQQTAAARANWRIASARLTRVLRLNPAAIVVPLEPPHLQVSLISPQMPVGELIPVGLTNRPELASQRALVGASSERVREERLRPWLPSVVVQGSGPGGFYNGGVFGGGSDNGPRVYDGRFDASVGAIWTLENMGAGNRALVRQRLAEEQRAAIDFADVQDRVAQDVVQAHAVLEAATVQVDRTASAVKEAVITYQGTLTGIGQTRGTGEVLQLVNRPQEAVAALIQLNRAYGTFYIAVNDYNRAQFQLYRALGYPAQVLVCQRPLGQVGAVDTSRPAGMAPVCQQHPCPCP
jgi:outer membrane protein TolC